MLSSSSATYTAVSSPSLVMLTATTGTGGNCVHLKAICRRHVRSAGGDKKFEKAEKEEEEKREEEEMKSLAMTRASKFKKAEKGTAVFFKHFWWLSPSLLSPQWNRRISHRPHSEEALRSFNNCFTHCKRLRVQKCFLRVFEVKKTMQSSSENRRHPTGLIGSWWRRSTRRFCLMSLPFEYKQY
ncbi:hypothetical protein PoB_001092400 [Plakobranchus ocellatus]|uniref:Uncharacterized protein n=1 Tax=Plakobranchus ocellatus TaxID=259542 RepID=A0AAV3YN43_9GAST|nr:hypothetical protein PoB_001092400 [Plakobranchus ocellatus]